MPTTRRRHLLTETEQVARALEDAERRWPEERSRSRLLVRLVEEGHRALVDAHEQHATEREAGIRRTSGVLTGAYGPNYLTGLRGDWPE